MKPQLDRRSRAIPRAQWDDYAGWHTYGPEAHSGSFHVSWQPGGGPRRAGWWVYDQTHDAYDGPFLSSRAAFVAARRGETGRIIQPVQINLDTLLGIG